MYARSLYVTCATIASVRWWTWGAAATARRLARGTAIRLVAPMARGRVAKPAASRSMSRNASSDTARRGAEKANESLLLDLGPLEEGVLVCRPSSRNRSPYVGDVRIVSGPNEGTTCVTHLPNLDSGGKCRPGVRVLCRRQPGVGPDTVGKFGTPKCELVCQLLRCEEPENAPFGVWVSAHPAIGEKLTQALMQRGAFDDRLFMRVGKSPAKRERGPSGTARARAVDVSIDASPEGRAVGGSQTDLMSSPVSSQVSRRREASESASGSFRPDFSVEHPDGSVTVVETKQVVDTDYDAKTAADAAALQPGHPVYAMRRAGSEPEATNTRESRAIAPYFRSGIFPWGKRGQKGPEGEPVVSRRAIDHLLELSAIARGEGVSGAPTTRAAVVLMAGRHDVHAIRPNGAACPSFAKHVAAARASGVTFLGHKVRWGEGPDAGKAFDAGPVPIEAPMREGDEILVPKPKKEKETTRSNAPRGASKAEAKVSRAKEAPVKCRSDEVSRDANERNAETKAEKKAEKTGPAKRRRRGTE